MKMQLYWNRITKLTLARLFYCCPIFLPAFCNVLRTKGQEDDAAALFAESVPSKVVLMPTIHRDAPVQNSELLLSHVERSQNWARELRGFWPSP